MIVAITGETIVKVSISNMFCVLNERRIEEYIPNIHKSLLVVTLCVLDVLVVFVCTFVEKLSGVICSKNPLLKWMLA